MHPSRSSPYLKESQSLHAPMRFHRASSQDFSSRSDASDGSVTPTSTPSTSTGTSPSHQGHDGDGRRLYRRRFTMAGDDPSDVRGLTADDRAVGLQHLPNASPMLPRTTSAQSALSAWDGNDDLESVSEFVVDPLRPIPETPKKRPKPCCLRVLSSCWGGTVAWLRGITWRHGFLFWTVFVLFLVLVSAFLIPFRLAFDLENVNYYLIIDGVLWFAFVADAIIHCCFPALKTVEETNRPGSRFAAHAKEDEEKAKKKAEKKAKKMAKAAKGKKGKGKEKKEKDAPEEGTEMKETKKMEGEGDGSGQKTQVQATSEDTKKKEKEKEEGDKKDKDKGPSGGADPDTDTKGSPKKKEDGGDKGGEEKKEADKNKKDKNQPKKEKKPLCSCCPPGLVAYMKSCWWISDLFPLIIPLGLGWPPLMAARMSKLIFLTYYYNAVASLFKFIPTHILRLLRSIFITIFAAHWMACVYFAVLMAQGPDETTRDFIPGDVDIFSMSPLRQYIRSFFWSFVTMTGYSNTQPVTTAEIIVSGGVSAIGLALYITIIGTVGSLVSNADAGAREFQRRMDELTAFMNFRKLDNKLRRQIVDYYDYVWKSRNTFNEARLLKDLPAKMRIDIAMCIAGDILKSVPLLQGAPEQLVETISLSLKPCLSLPDVLLVNKGDIAREMLLLVSGCFHVVDDKDNVVEELRSGGYYGQEALVCKCIRQNSVISINYCDYYTLSRNDFQRVLSSFPDEDKRIRACADKLFDGVADFGVQSSDESEPEAENVG